MAGAFSHPRGSQVELCVFGRLTRALGATILLLTAITPVRNPLGAPRRQEFTHQGLLVSPFKSADKKLGNHVAGGAELDDRRDCGSEPAGFGGSGRPRGSRPIRRPLRSDMFGTGSWRWTFPVAADALDAPVVAARCLSLAFLR